MQFKFELILNINHEKQLVFFYHQPFSLKTENLEKKFAFNPF